MPATWDWRVFAARAYARQAFLYADQMSATVALFENLGPGGMDAVAAAIAHPPHFDLGSSLPPAPGRSVFAPHSAPRVPEELDENQQLRALDALEDMVVAGEAASAPISAPPECCWAPQGLTRQPHARDFILGVQFCFHF